MNKKINRISIVSYGRKGSKRCPNKLLRKFNKTTIVDILLSKLSNFDNSYFGGYDYEFKNKCKKHKVNFIQRTKKSVSIDYPIMDALDFMRNLNSEYILLINGCLPFLSIETINEFLKFVKKNKYAPASAVTLKSNYFFDKNFKPLNFTNRLKTLNTKNVEEIYEYANALYFFNKNYFFKYGKYWDWKKVLLFNIEKKIELIDIDTEEDFYLAKNLWKSIYE